MKKVFTNIVSTAAIALPYLALAQFQRVPVPGQLGSVIDRLANIAVSIIIAISVCYILYGAVLYMTGGAADKEGKARNTILYAIVAVIVAVLARVIVNVVVEVATIGVGGGASFH